MSDRIYFKPVKEWHIDYVAKHMRQADILEVKSSHGYAPHVALSKAVEKSDRCRVVIYNGTPVAIFGLCKGAVISGVGVPWFLGTDEVLKLGKSLTKYGKIVVNEMLSECSLLVNYVHVKNRLSVGWLRRMGFTMDEPQAFLHTGELFHRFHKRGS